MKAVKNVRFLCFVFFLTVTNNRIAQKEMKVRQKLKNRINNKIKETKSLLKERSKNYFWLRKV